MENKIKKQNKKKSIKAYKLFRVRKDGTIGSLFINRKMRIPTGKWLIAKKEFKVKGFSYRPFWHSSHKPIAPHLSKKGRKWYVVEIEKFQEMKRPKNQGGLWYLSRRIKIIGEHKK